MNAFKCISPAQIYLQLLPSSLCIQPATRYLPLDVLRHTKLNWTHYLPPISMYFSYVSISITSFTIHSQSPKSDIQPYSSSFPSITHTPNCSHEFLFITLSLAYIIPLTQMVLLISTLLLSKLFYNPARVIFTLLLRILQQPPYALYQVWTLLTLHKQQSWRPVLFQPISYPTSPRSLGGDHTEHFNSTFSLSVKSLRHGRHLLNICLIELNYNYAKFIGSSSYAFVA